MELFPSSDFQFMGSRCHLDQKARTQLRSLVFQQKGFYGISTMHKGGAPYVIPYWNEGELGRYHRYWCCWKSSLRPTPVPHSHLPHTHTSMNQGETRKEDALTEGQGTGPVCWSSPVHTPRVSGGTSWSKSQQAALIWRLPVLRYPFPTWHHNLAVHIPQEKLPPVCSAATLQTEQSCTYWKEFFFWCDNIKVTCNQTPPPEAACCLQNRWTPKAKVSIPACSYSC